MQAALTSFRTDLARIDKLANWLTTPEALVVDMNQATWAVRCGAVVLLSGYFESFLKECMTAFIKDVNALNKPIAKLPSRMRNTHFEVGAKILSRLIKQERKQPVAVQCENLSSRLASVKASVGYTLAWEAFSDTKANPGAEVVADLLRAVGVNNAWSKLHAATPAGLGDLRLFLDTFIPMRNECAHSGSMNSPPTASDLAQYCSNFNGLGTSILAVLTQQMTELSAL
jgi:hypothetical protein